MVWTRVIRIRTEKRHYNYTPVVGGPHVPHYWESGSEVQTDLRARPGVSDHENEFLWRSYLTGRLPTSAMPSELLPFSMWPPGHLAVGYSPPIPSIGTPGEVSRPSQRQRSLSVLAPSSRISWTSRYRGRSPSSRPDGRSLGSDRGHRDVTRRPICARSTEPNSETPSQSVTYLIS